MIETLSIHGWGFTPAYLPSDLLGNDVRHIDLYQLYAQVSKPSLINLTDQIAMQITQPVNIIAWSLGGVFALQLAKDHADKINRLLLFSTTPKFMQSKNWQGLSLAQIRLLKTTLKQAPQTALQEFAKWCGMNTQTEGIIKQSLADKVSYQVLVDLLDILVKFDFCNQLAQVKQPVQFVNGDQDQVVTARNLKLCCQAQENLQLQMLKNKSHSLPFELTQSDCMAFNKWLYTDHG